MSINNDLIQILKDLVQEVRVIHPINSPDIWISPLHEYINELEDQINTPNSPIL